MPDAPPPPPPPPPEPTPAAPVTDQWLELLREPAAVVGADGVVHAANGAFLGLLNGTGPRPRPPLQLSTQDPAQLAEALSRWVRCAQATPRSLRLAAHSGVADVVVEAGRLNPGVEPALVLLRAQRRRESVRQFRLLGEKIDALAAEVARRRGAEAALWSQRENYRTTLASIGDAVIATDAQGRVVFMNPIAEGLTGWGHDDARNRPCADVFHIVNETTRRPVESPVSRVIREGVIVGLANHTVLIARDGAEHPVDDSGAPIRDADGNLVGTVLVFRDIGDRRDAELALRESEARFRLMADAAPVLIWVADTTARCTYFNRQWLDYTGRALEQELGEGWVEGVHADDRERCVQTYRSSFDARKPFRIEYRLRGRDGVFRWFMDHGVPRHGPEGAFAGYIGSCIDITARRDTEEQLRTLNDQLEQRVAQRTAQLRELTAQLTRVEQRERRRLAQTLHDHLQQLLVAARMRTDLMLHTTDDAEVHDAATQVRDLIRQSIEASRTLTVELSPPVLYDGGLAAALPWLARQVLEHHGLHVDTQVDPDAEPDDEETRVTLFLTVRELLFNIVKHAGVREARVTMTAPDARTLRVVVADRGAGFDPATRQPPSTQGGFGLFSIRERLTLLGGRVDIDSAPGRGTTITLTAPRHAAAPSAGADPATDARGGAGQIAPHPNGDGDGQPIRVLLVDDHRILRDGIARMLAEAPDIRVVAAAGNGREAVDLALTHRPDVIVMDITMPVMNGIEATRIIKQQAPTTRVIGLSMHDSPDMAHAMLDAGAAAMLIKDGPSDDLLTAIRATPTAD